MKINTKDGSWGSKRASRNQTEESKSFNTPDEIQHLAGKGEEQVFINRTNSSPRLYKCESTHDDKKDMSHVLLVSVKHILLWANQIQL